MRLSVAGAAADSGQAAGTTRHATGAGELPTGATAHARDAALTTRTATGPSVRAAGAAVSVGVAAAAARVILEDHVRWRGGVGGRSGDGNVGGGRGRCGDSRCDCPGYNQRFHECQFR